MNGHDERLSCPTWETLLKWTEGELPQEDAELAVHVKRCPLCEQRLQFLDSVGETLRRASGDVHKG